MAKSKEAKINYEPVECDSVPERFKNTKLNESQKIYFLECNDPEPPKVEGMIWFGSESGGFYYITN